MKSVIEILNPDDAAIASAKLLYSDSKIEGQLAFIKANFNFLTQGITRIEEKDASLEISLTLLKKIESELKTGRGEVRRRVSKKLQSVGYNTVAHL